MAVQVFIESVRVGTAKRKDLEARKLLSFLQVTVWRESLLMLQCVASICCTSGGIEAAFAAPGNLQEWTHIPRPSCGF